MERQGLDEATRRALDASPFGALPSAAIDRLLASAVLLDAPAGAILYRAEDPARGALVVDGLVRLYITSVDGRQLTIRYVRGGEQVGVGTAIHGPFAASAQAVIDCSLLWFSVPVLRDLAMTDVRVAWPLAEELGRRLAGLMDATASAAFGSVRQRVARQLLDLCVRGQRGPELMAHVNQQAIADAVGTTREVVARTLRDLRDAGLIKTGRSSMQILDPERLEAVVTTGEL